MVVAFSVDQEVEDLGNFSVLDHGAQADRADIVERDFHFEAAGFDLEEVKLQDIEADRATADLFDDPNPMIWINNLVADLKA